MKNLEIFLLLAIASTAAADDVVPSYHKHLNYFDEAKRIFQSLAYPPDGGSYDLPSKYRDYILLVGFLDTLSQRLVTDLRSNYHEVYYEELNNTVPFAWSNPWTVADSLTYEINVIDNEISNIRELTASVCGIQFRSSREVPCDKMVDLQMKINPTNFTDQANILEALGVFSALYVDEPYGDRAHNLDMIAFLLNGKDELQELTELLASVKALYYASKGILFDTVLN